jgi:peptidyl-prolyl cis-trans isomerase SurA
MALVRRLAGMASLAAALTGCSTPDGASKLARDENRKMDTLLRSGDELEQEAKQPALIARSQVPEVLPPVRLGTPTPMTPPAAPLILPPNPGERPADGIRSPDIVAPTELVTPATRTEPMAPPAPGLPVVPRLEGDSQVRIVASIGNNPIYESEVREAVYQRMGELMRLTESQRAAKEREIFREELRKIIERELVLDEMNAALSSKKQSSVLNKLHDAASKEADQRLKEFKKERGIPSDAEFKDALRGQGLTLSGIRRQIERGFMMQTYMREKLSPKMDSVGLADVREYFAAHPDEFQAEDRVKWQDLFVLKERFKSPVEAKQYADSMVARSGKGEDFMKLATDFSMGDSKFRNGAGVGEKAGEIFPQELEPTILALKAGQLAVKESETGFHVLRVSERTYAGVKPYDEKLQAEVKRKLQAQIYEREAKRYVETLWKRIQPQVWEK